MDLKKYIRNVPDFPVKGIQFKDITPLLKNVEAFTFTIKTLAGLYDSGSIDKVVALESRGFILGSAVAYELSLPFIPIRKAGKLPYITIKESYGLEYGEAVMEIHTDSIGTEDKVLMVDDLLATGGSLRAATNLVEKLEGKVIGCSVLIELDDLKGREKLNGFDIKSIIHY